MKKSLSLMVVVFFCSQALFAGHHQGSWKSFLKHWNEKQREFMGNKGMDNAKGVNNALFELINVIRKYPSTGAVLTSALDLNQGESSFDNVKLLLDEAKEPFLTKKELLIDELIYYFEEESSPHMLMCLNFWIDRLNSFSDNIIFNDHEESYKMLKNALIAQQNKVAQELDSAQENSYAQKFQNMSNAAYSVLGDLVRSVDGSNAEVITKTLVTLMGAGGGGLPMMVLQQLLEQMIKMLLGAAKEQGNGTELVSKNA